MIQGITAENPIGNEMDTRFMKRFREGGAVYRTPF